jgi:NADH dehydrogenase/NADH:ubiquinone oxidoreductase subunit G
MKITINNQKLSVEEGATVLEAALANGIDIPRLCYHPALPPYGACRVCLVEVEKGGRKRLTTSCTYPVSEGLVVQTKTEEVLQARKFTISLLLMLAPEAEAIKQLAEEYGVAPRFETRGDANGCIRCGLCVRVCRELMGHEAIGFINRGVERIPETPFSEDNPDCVSCGACAYLCPTGYIKVIDNKHREIEAWHKKEELAECRECGQRFAPGRLLQEVKDTLRELEISEILALCPECRRKETLIGERLRSSKR